MIKVLPGSMSTLISSPGSMPKKKTGVGNRLVSDYLRAWVRSAQLRSFLRDRFGEGWWRSRDTGDFLRGLFAEGTEPSSEEIAERLGYDPHDTAPVGPAAPPARSLRSRGAPPSTHIARYSIRICCTSRGARPSEGSSSSSSRGAAISPREMASICCCPPLSVPAAMWRRSRKTGNRPSCSSA